MLSSGGFSLKALASLILACSFLLAYSSGELPLFDERGNRIALLPVHELKGEKYILLDDLCPAFNARQRYVPITGEILVLIRGHRVKLKIGSRDAVVDGFSRRKALTRAPLLISDRPALPLEFITDLLPELLGVSISYDPSRSALFISSPTAPAPERGGVIGVVIDPGHGGPDDGITLRGISEKELTLKISLKLSEKLRERGFRVLLTREGDEGVSRLARINAANASGADLFISIHLGSSISPLKRGFRIFLNRPWREVEIEGAAAPVGLRATQSKLDKLAERLKAELEGLGMNGAIYRLPLSALAGLNVPALLFEPGFLTNDADRALLTDDDFLSSMADAICRAIEGVYGEGKGR